MAGLGTKPSARRLLTGPHRGSVSEKKILWELFMPSSKIAIEINAPAQATFDLIHQYDKRLLWDSMLREARLLDGATVAAQGVRSAVPLRWQLEMFVDSYRGDLRFVQKWKSCCS